MQPWRVEQSHGGAGAFHAVDPRGDRSATFHTVDRPTLVVGSTQRSATVDTAAATDLGVEVVRRRSGGGGVLLVPGEFVWLDLVIPAGDPLWSDDVAAAMVWVGELWQRALHPLGEGDLQVHQGPLLASPWSGVVCWAGVGTGELMRGAAKLVGISQRRTRGWARFQSMCHLQWRPEMVAALVAPPRPAATEMDPLAACSSSPAATICAALVAALPD